jgi:superfamily II DNA or RNA helicase
VLPVGHGKTRSGLSVAHASAQRSLIVCKTGLIYDQWCEELKTVYGPDVEWGEIRQSKWEIGEFVTLASWQTLTRREKRWDELSQSHGILLLDECQALPAPVMGQFARYFGGMYKVGLTATDTRTDGLKPYLTHELGDRFYYKAASKKETDTTLPIADVIQVDTDFKYTPPVERDKQGNEIEKPFGFVACNRAASRDVKRNLLILEHVLEHHSKGHSCLVLTQFTEHARFLRGLFKNRGIKSTLMIGGMTPELTRKKVRRVMSGKARIVVATIQFIGEGANIPPLDRLFLTMSLKNRNLMMQATGRIRRKWAGKKDAVVIDFVDTYVGVLRRHFTQHRVPMYRNALGVPRFKNQFYI